MLVFCVLYVQGTAIFMGSSRETSILLHSHNMRQDKIASKFVACEGRSVLPIQNRYLVKLRPWPKDLQPLHLGWEFQFSVLISRNLIGSGIPIAEFRFCF
jgi:hypothetical protein